MAGFTEAGSRAPAREGAGRVDVLADDVLHDGADRLHLAGERHALARAPDVLPLPRAALLNLPLRLVAVADNEARHRVAKEVGVHPLTESV